MSTIDDVTDSTASKRRGSYLSTSCRICHESSEETSLIRPCNCSGTQQFIHFHCLKEWIETSNDDVCSVCKTKYDGLVMTSSKISFISYLTDYATPDQDVLKFTRSIFQLLMGLHYIWVTIMACAYSWDNHSLFFTCINLVIHGFFLFIVFCVCVKAVNSLKDTITTYRAYCETHQSFKVSQFEDRITKHSLIRTRRRSSPRLDRMNRQSNKEVMS